MEYLDKLVEETGIDREIAEKAASFIETNVVPDYKKAWDGKANTDAEGILTGASKYVSDKFGVQIEREQGEKYADYLQRVSETIVTSKLSDKEKELQEKLKNFKGNDALKSQYEKELANERAEKDKYLQKLAKLEPLEGLDEKYKEATSQLSSLKLSVAFGNAKPNFPETVNKYEAEAKWNEFKNGVLENNNIEIEGNIAYAIDKENPHKKVKLTELVEKNTNIAELLKGRQQRGNGASSVDLKSVEGLPFKVPSNATSEELTSLVREHLIKELGSVTAIGYTQKFKELYSKAKNA
jgi:hypothetical protein